MSAEITHYGNAELLPACDTLRRDPTETLSMTFRLSDITCETCKINPYGVKVGQVWQDCDKRMQDPPRYLRIAEILPASAQARVVRCNARGGLLMDKYTRAIKLRRFQPTHTGYRLVKDVTP